MNSDKIHKAHKQNLGFTLIEVLSSLFMAAWLLIAGFSLLFASIQALDQTHSLGQLASIKRGYFWNQLSEDFESSTQSILNAKAKDSIMLLGQSRKKNIYYEANFADGILQRFLLDKKDFIPTDTLKLFPTEILTLSQSPEGIITINLGKNSGHSFATLLATTRKKFL